MSRTIKGIKFEQTLRELVKAELPCILEKQLVELIGVRAQTINMYLSRAEFNHIKKKCRPKRYCGIKEKDIVRLKYLLSRHCYED